ncbi:MAG TPA: hypothetical protein VF088_20275 [Pyrinomonadaceae bacterium]
MRRSEVTNAFAARIIPRNTLAATFNNLLGTFSAQSSLPARLQQGDRRESRY